MEQLPLIVLLMSASWLDLRTHKIPNMMTLPFIPLGLLFHAGFGEGILFSLAGLGFAFLILFPVFVCRFLAGGDVKLGLCIGTFLGWQLFLESLLYGLIIGLPLVLLYAWKEVGWSGFKQTFMRYGFILGSRKYLSPVAGELGGLKVPYGPALALGAGLAMALHHFGLFRLVS
ncbi:prepilin peptidase CpaA [Oceanisphaera litoralis]|uniref:A24 family peptidase n=1 Tax=Oceanisphaera litoralis TaxID=225144 RepID=UPI00195683E2|nr:A24 family peptidase [Oceanisphaera litoralis]MBM7454248.1 prepilin peptidase CpaA [Oceanisphaera litoralis]